jgi:hypothetical protein
MRHLNSFAVSDKMRSFLGPELSALVHVFESPAQGPSTLASKDSPRF